MDGGDDVVRGRNEALREFVIRRSRGTLDTALQFLKFYLIYYYYYFFNFWNIYFLNKYTSVDLFLMKNWNFKGILRFLESFQTNLSDEFSLRCGGGLDERLHGGHYRFGCWQNLLVEREALINVLKIRKIDILERKVDEYGFPFNAINPKNARRSRTQNSIFDTSCMLVVVNRTEPKNTRHIKDKGRWNERGFIFKEKGPNISGIR